MKHALHKIPAAILLLALGGAASAADVQIKLSGDQETPAVTTSASGSGTLSVGDDKSISGSIKTKDLAGATAAHIHKGAAGDKGPPVVHLTKASESEWTVPAGSKLSDEDYESFKAGKLYVNIHTAANKGGEIRGQIAP
ncbi:CHRD domain-containing protein [Solimonas sp. K1W22B-7]|uniref:CHRD domain-containing protein n=1 Tax=Solimonas sp. K1W22B-7 TaxID=2303331 RepID=UPI000E33452E|nr:CHRD domain-containing protein [Solimonas sp. K1W22B-7]AXQ28476.1 CHRD domain-containing protein [Solimonas sp. K1W22B-7]